MESARSVADMGFQVYLVEQGDKLGGQAWNLVVSSGLQLPGLLEELIRRFRLTPISSCCSLHVKATSGFIGNFASMIQTSKASANWIRRHHHGYGGQPYKPEEYLYGQNPMS